MFINKFSSKNLQIILKFGFARRIPNSNAKSQNNPLFNKFTIETDLKGDNHFSRKLRKELGNDSLEMSEEEKILLRQYEKEMGSGQKIKNPIEEILENDQIPKIIQDEQGSNQTLNPMVKFLKEEVDRVKKMQSDKNNVNTSDSPQLFTKEDLEFLVKNKKSKNLKEKKNSINPKNLKLDDSRILDGEESIDKINQNFRKLVESEDETREKEFYDLFDKSKLNKNKKIKNKIEEDEELNQFKENERTIDFSKIRNLRKIKNPTNREYNNSIKPIDDNNVEIIDSIPDMNLIEKRSRNAEDEERFKDLVRSDIRPYEKSLEKKEALLHDAQKLSKITTINNINLKNNRNEIFKRRAIQLSKLWQMPAPETKHWYYKLRREEKEIIKVINMRKRLEQKRKLKKIQKQWTIDNKEIFDINYADFLSKDNSSAIDSKDINENIKIPNHFKNINEFIFFGEDTEFLRHYKRTCKNIENVLNEFFLTNKQSIITGIGRNADITINEVKMNKACTVIYAWWDLPYMTNEIIKIKNEENEAIYKNIEFKINQATPYLKSVLTRKIGLKYAPDIKFVRDNFDEEINSFEEYLNEMRNERIETQQGTGPDKNSEIFIKILTSKDFIDALKEELNKIKSEESKIFFKDFFLDEKIDLRNKLIAIKRSDPKMFNNLLNQMKKLVDFSKFEENLKNDEKNKENMTKAEKRAKIKRDKIMKKLRLNEEDLKNDKKIDYTNSLYNFVQNFERKIPGQFTLGTSFKEMSIKSDKSEFLSEVAENNLKKEINKAVKDSEMIGKTRKTKREKSVDFWRNLEKGVI